MLRRKVKTPVVSTRGCLTWGALNSQGVPPATSLLLAPSPPHHQFLPLLCSHKPQDRKLWLTHAGPGLSETMSHWEFRVLPWTRWEFPHSEGGRGLQKPTIGLTLAHCLESIRCGLALTASKWGLGYWIIAGYNHTRKRCPPKFISQ